MSESYEPICHVLATLDGETEELIEVLEISHFDLTAFSKQFDVPVESDPEMLDRYAVGPIDIDFLRSRISPDLQFDFSRYAYFIEAARRD